MLEHFARVQYFRDADARRARDSFRPQGIGGGRGRVHTHAHTDADCDTHSRAYADNYAGSCARYKY